MSRLPLGERARERRQRLVGGHAVVAERAVKAGALAGVAGRPGRLDQGQQRVGVAVEAQRPQPLHVT